MTDQPTTRDQLIEQAARVIHAARYAKADEPTAVDEFIAAGLAEHGLLADPEQHAELLWLHAEAAWRVAGFDVLTVALARKNKQLTAERDEAVALCANLQTTLLSRLADLAEAAGKARSTEWLRTCSTLPMEEWPPAPAYKGPMVPAADLDQARADAREWERVAKERNPTARDMANLRDQVAAAEADRDTARSDREELRSERDEIAGELEDAQQHARNVAAQRDVEHRAFVEAAAQRDALQARIDESAKRFEMVLASLGDCECPNHAGIRNVVLMLRGDAPAEPSRKRWVSDREYEVGNEPTHDAGADARAALQGDQPTEAFVTDNGEPHTVDRNGTRHYQPKTLEVAEQRCAGCSGTNITYQAFSGGREYYCEDCDDTFPYDDGKAPRRAQMLADGRHEELRGEMREHLRTDPTVTPPDPSGRITDGGPVVPFDLLETEEL